MISLYQNPWFKVVKDNKYHYILEEGAANGAVVLALVKKRFVFVRIHRPAHNLDLLEAPRGYGNKGESSESCAIRELFEETGHKFEISELQKIGHIRPNSAILSSVVPVYFIESDCNEPAKPPDEEVLEVEYIPEKNIYEEIARGHITDGFTLSALSFYWARKYNKA